MPRRIAPELSDRNPWHLSKHRFYELKHFCLQYPEWRKEIAEITYYQSHYSGPRSMDISDPVFRAAHKLARLERNIEMIEAAARESDRELYSWLFRGVTEEISYTTLSTLYDIPCSRDTYYDRYRKFFWILSRKISSLL